MNSQGFSQTPQDIMEEYNGCSVPQYTRYPLTRCLSNGEPIAQLLCISTIQEFSFIERIEAMFAIIQEDAAASCNQSPAFPGNAPSE